MNDENNIVINKHLHEEINISQFHIPRWNELPNIDLFLEQVVTLINASLKPYIFFSDENKEDNELLTKTMINNYVKHGIIEPPVKKQYSKSQVAKLFAICVLKQVYSMEDIKTLIAIALKSEIQVSYDKFCSLFEQALDCAYNKKDYIDNTSTNQYQYLLKTVLLSCSYKIYSKNIVSLENKNNTKEI